MPVAGGGAGRGTGTDEGNDVGRHASSGRSASGAYRSLLSMRRSSRRRARRAAWRTVASRMPNTGATVAAGDAFPECFSHWYSNHSSRIALADLGSVEGLGQQPGTGQVGDQPLEGVEQRAARVRLGTLDRLVGQVGEVGHAGLVERLGPRAEHAVDHVGDAVPRPHPRQRATLGAPRTCDLGDLVADLEHEALDVVAPDRQFAPAAKREAPPTAAITGLRTRRIVSQLR